MSSVLDRITSEVLAGEAGKSLLRKATGRTVLDVAERIDSDFFLIAEIKRRSPSRGLIREKFNPAELALKYQAAGVSAISVVTEEKHFGGKPEYLTLVRKLVDVPILRKDFILTERQVLESFNLGADMVLLIAACLNDEELKRLYGAILDLGMTPLVEVHHKQELHRVLNMDPVLIGVNNRNLHDFSVDISRSIELGKGIPSGIRRISESGIKTPTDIRKLKKAGYSGALVGESILSAQDTEKAIEELLNG